MRNRCLKRASSESSVMSLIGNVENTTFSEKTLKDSEIEQSINNLTKEELLENLKNIVQFSRTVKSKNGNKSTVFLLCRNLRKKAIFIVEKLNKISEDEKTFKNSLNFENSVFDYTMVENSRCQLLASQTGDSFEKKEKMQSLNEEVREEIINNGKEISHVKKILEQKIEFLETTVTKLKDYIPIQDKKLGNILENTRETRAIITNQIKISNDLNSIKNIIEEKSKVDKQNNINYSNNENFRSYAEALKSPPTTLLIKPTENENMTELQNLIKNFESQICPTKIYFGETAIKIKCANVLDKENLEKELLQKRLNVMEAKPIKQKLIIFNVPEKYEDSFIINKFGDLINVDTTQRNIEIITKIGSKKFDKAVHVVMEIPRKNTIELIKRGYIYLGFKKYFIQKYITMKRCTRCQSLNHTLKNCTSKFHICYYCGINHNLTFNCKKQPPTCINCKKSKLSKNIHHTASNLKCPTFESKLNNNGKYKSQIYQNSTNQLK